MMAMVPIEGGVELLTGLLHLLWYCLWDIHRLLRAWKGALRLTLDTKNARIFFLVYNLYTAFRFD